MRGRLLSTVTCVLDTTIPHDRYWPYTMLILLISHKSCGAKQFSAAQGKVNPLPSTSSELMLARRAEQIFFMVYQKNAVWANSIHFQGTQSKAAFAKEKSSEVCR